MMAPLQHRGGRPFNTVAGAPSTPWGRPFNTVPPRGGRPFNTVGGAPSTPWGTEG
jgi:hypothetical protein